MEYSITINNHSFNLEIADTPEKRNRGLMFRKELDQDSGMLFVFPEENYYGFWMKNTLIPLDIIWIDENKKVADIVTAFPPENDNIETFHPREKSLWVLEINGGLSNKLGIKIGDSVEFKNIS